MSPTDTAGAALAIAHQPAANVSAIYLLAPSNPPFNPTLSTAPNDFTIGLLYSGNGIADAYAVAIDKLGNEWIASSEQGTVAGTSTPSSAPASVVEIANPQAMKSSGMTYLSGSSGYAASEFSSHQYIVALAIDPTNQSVWVATDSTLEELTTGGSLEPGSPFLSPSTPGFSAPMAIAIDGYGYVWTAAGSGLYEVSSTGSLMSPNGGYSLGSANQYPQAVAIDGSENVWVVDYFNNALIEVSQAGTATQISAPQRSISYPDGVAIDNSQDVWIANAGNYVASEYSTYARQFLSDKNTNSYGFALGTSSSVQNGESASAFVSLDAGGHSLYAVDTSDCSSANNANLCIGTAELAPNGAPLSGPAGYSLDGTNHVSGQPDAHYGVAVDGSGNEWVVNTLADSVTELIGVGSPVITPLSAAVLANKIAATP